MSFDTSPERLKGVFKYFGRHFDKLLTYLGTSLLSIM